MIARGTIYTGEPTIIFDPIERTIAALMATPDYNRELIAEQLDVPVEYILMVEESIMLYVDMFYYRARKGIMPWSRIWTDTANAFIVPQITEA